MNKITTLSYTVRGQAVSVLQIPKDLIVVTSLIVRSQYLWTSRSSGHSSASQVVAGAVCIVLAGPAAGETALPDT